MKDDLKTYRFNFKAFLGEFSLNAPNITCPLIATWKRSSQSASTPPAQMKAGKANFNQTLTLPLNMYYDSSKQAFQDKKTLFTFTMSTPKGDKQAGVVYVEVAQLLNNKMQKIEGNYTLQKCPVKDSKVSISIEAELIGEGSTSDTMSVDSTLFNQGDLSTLSTTSIQSKQEIDTEKPSPTEPSVSKKPEGESKVEEEGRAKRTDQLERQVEELTRQKQKLLRQLQKSRSRDDNKELSQLREELVKSKGIHQKLQREITNLRGQNIEHERQLQKMRIRMENIYDLLLGNLNSLY